VAPVDGQVRDFLHNNDAQVYYVVVTIALAAVSTISSRSDFGLYQRGRAGWPSGTVPAGSQTRLKLRYWEPQIAIMPLIGRLINA
jgi:hypothetical protein